MNKSSGIRTYKRPHRVLELKHRCIDRRHRQFIDNDTAVEEYESRNNNSLTLAPYQSSDADFIVKDQLPVELGFFSIFVL